MADFGGQRLKGLCSRPENIGSSKNYSGKDQGIICQNRIKKRVSKYN